MGAIEHTISNPSLRIGLKEPIVQTIATRRRHYKFQDTFSKIAQDF